jgi:hypothetical protein
LTPESSCVGAVAERAFSRIGPTNTGSAPTSIAIPSRSVTATNACICREIHGASPPKPVVVNISTANRSDSRVVRGRSSYADIPKS